MVYLVRELESQQCFAAKFIKTRRRSYRELAHEEISILQSLSHENIIRYVDSYSDPSSIVIVMEYLDGGELFVKIADEDFSLTEADCVMFVAQICTGVQYLHSRNIVHLDLKVICNFQMGQMSMITTSHFSQRILFVPDRIGSRSLTLAPPRGSLLRSR